jgi:hypothetical protein
MHWEDELFREVLQSPVAEALTAVHSALGTFYDKASSFMKDFMAIMRQLVDQDDMIRVHIWHPIAETLSNSSNTIMSIMRNDSVNHAALDKMLWTHSYDFAISQSLTSICLKNYPHILKYIGNAISTMRSRGFHFGFAQLFDNLRRFGQSIPLEDIDAVEQTLDVYLNECEDDQCEIAKIALETWFDNVCGLTVTPANASIGLIRLRGQLVKKQLVHPPKLLSRLRPMRVCDTVEASSTAEVPIAETAQETDQDASIDEVLASKEKDFTKVVCFEMDTLCGGSHFKDLISTLEGEKDVQTCLLAFKACLKTMLTKPRHATNRMHLYRKLYRKSGLNKRLDKTAAQKMWRAIKSVELCAEAIEWATRK